MAKTGENPLDVGLSVYNSAVLNDKPLECNIWNF